MPTKERTRGTESWIVTGHSHSGRWTAERLVQRKDKITYSANKPAYVSFNTCSHTRDYPDASTSQIRIPLSPIATGVIARPTEEGVGLLPYTTQSTSAITYAYSSTYRTKTLGSKDYQAKVYDAVLAAYAQARSIPSILQPVIELRDVKQTVRQTTALANWLVSRPSSVRQYIRKGASFGRVVKDFIRSISEQSSNSYLMTTFGIMPTVGDAAKIARTIANPDKFVKARLNVIPKNTVLRATFHCLSEKPSFDMSTRIDMRNQHRKEYYGSPFYMGITTTDGLAQRAVALLGDNTPYIVSDVHGLVFIKARVDTEIDNSLLNDWNYTQTAGAIPWELVPFSFVVDWFYDVGAQLQRAEKRSNVYRRVRLSDFSKPWVCTHRETYTLSASCSSRSSISGVRAYGVGYPTYDCFIEGQVQQIVLRKALKNYISREFVREPWQGHLYNLPEQDFSLPVRPYQVAASLALLAQKFLRLGRN